MNMNTVSQDVAVLATMMVMAAMMFGKVAVRTRQLVRARIANGEDVVLLRYWGMMGFLWFAMTSLVCWAGILVIANPTYLEGAPLWLEIWCKGSIGMIGIFLWMVWPRREWRNFPGPFNNQGPS